MRVSSLMGIVVLLSSCSSNPDKRVTWNLYKADAASTSYVALDQINENNVQQLKVA